MRSYSIIVRGEATEVGILLNDGTIRAASDTTVDGPVGARVVTSRWWKGIPRDTVMVIWQPFRHVAVSEVFPLVTGQRYVLFLVPEGDRIWSYGCGGSSGGARADTVAAILDSLSR